MGAKYKGGIVNDLRDWESIATYIISGVSLKGGTKYSKKWFYIHVFRAEEILCEFECELKQDPIGTASLVP